MVLTFHFELPGVPFRAGGYLGVDIFFVLSGYLITSLLIVEWMRFGSVSLGNFYARRALRLLPMVGVLLAAGAFVVVAMPAGYPERPEPIAFVAVATYWTNWLQIWQFGDAGMFGHAWSLAIEEQFYFVWPPLVVLLLMAARRNSMRAKRALVFGVSTLGSLIVGANRAFVWSTMTSGSESASPLVRYASGVKVDDAFRHWYFGSFTRSSGLLIGAALAAVLGSLTVRTALARRRRVTVGVGVLGGVGVAAVVGVASRAPYQNFLPTWGLSVLELGVAAIIVTIVVAPSAVIDLLLANGMMRWVGRRSYGIYILHIPVLLAVRGLALVDGVAPTSRRWTEGLIAGGVTAASAGLTYRFLEMPALRLKRHFTRRDS